MKSVDESGKNILVVEGNHEGLVTKCNDGELVGAAERYGAVLQGLEKICKLQLPVRIFQMTLPSCTMARYRWGGIYRFWRLLVSGGG